MKKVSYIYLLTVLAATLSGCNSSLKGNDYKGKSGVDYKISFYDNNDFNDYENSGNSTIQGQTDDAGIGDPYILRYNGVYYLYSACSIANGGKVGIKAWKSTDLINWTRCQGKGLDKGYVSSPNDSVTTGAYGPEVHYSNGVFYMYESKFSGSSTGAAGHHILSSDSPEGPFVEISGGAIDAHYDGTVVKDSYENMFFLTAGEEGIHTGTMSSMTKIIDTKTVVNETNYAGIYSDSPSVFEYMGKYYLLYSGAYEGVDNYQICYSVSDGWGNDDTPEGIASSFKKGANLPLLTNADTDKGFTGLGSPSAVLGPDLDSHYIAYQNTNRRKGVDRSFNLDRLFVSGDLLTTSHNRYEAVKPTLPEFVSEDETGLTSEGNFLLSDKSTSDVFSAEYNLINFKDTQCVFSYKDANNYSYIYVDLANNNISVYKVENGQAKELTYNMLFENYLSNCLHTVRVAYRDGKLDVHFDNVSKISAFDVELDAGKIGYQKGNETTIAYTCFSNVARGLSDQVEVKQSSLDIPATNYMKEGQIEDVKSYSFGNGSGITLISKDDEYTGAKQLSLKNKWDFARYLVNFKSSDSYSLNIVLNKESAGGLLNIEFDDDEDISLKIPAYSFSEETASNNYMRVCLGNFKVDEGIRQVRLANAGTTEVEIISFSFVKHLDEQYTFSSALTDERTAGLDVVDDSTWHFANDAMFSNKGERNFAPVSEKNIQDFEMQVEIALPTPNLYSLSSVAGIAYHVTNYAVYDDLSDGDYLDAELDDSNYAFQGYYIAITTMDIALKRANLGEDKTEQLVKVSQSITAKTYHKVAVKVTGNKTLIYLDGTLVIKYYDDLAFNTGAVGLYASDGEMSAKNFKLRTIA